MVQGHTADVTEVWLLPTGAVEDGVAPPGAARLLDPAERAAAARFVRPADRARSAAAHAALRVLVGTALGRRPAEVVLARAACPLCGEAHGRPVVVDGGGLELSLSHTAGLVAVALGPHTVGVDAEALDRAPEPAELDGFLAPAERAALARGAPDGRRRAALACWVRKEAYLKGIGTGLGIDPAGVAVGLGDGPAAGPRPGPPGWWFADLDAGPHHLAAVAVASPDGAPPPPPVVRTVPVADLVAGAGS